MEGNPEVTLGICAYNEENNVGYLLENLLSQDIPYSNEILVVSDGSTDKTEKIVQEYVRRSSRIRLITHKTREGKSSVLNTILKEASGGIIVIMSADLKPLKRSINTLIKLLKESEEYGLTWARPIPINEETDVVGRIDQLTFRLHDRLTRKMDAEGILKHSTGELIAIRKGILTRIPPDCINDDAYMSLRTVQKGFRVKYVADANVHIKMPDTISDYVKQRRRWVYGHIQIERMTGEMPTVMESLILKKPLMVLKTILEEMRERPYAIPIFMLAVVLEGYVALSALTDIAKKKRYALWEIIESTKTGFAKR